MTQRKRLEWLVEVAKRVRHSLLERGVRPETILLTGIPVVLLFLDAFRDITLIFLALSVIISLSAQLWLSPFLRPGHHTRPVRRAERSKVSNSRLTDPEDLEDHHGAQATFVSLYSKQMTDLAPHQRLALTTLPDGRPNRCMAEKWWKYLEIARSTRSAQLSRPTDEMSGTLHREPCLTRLCE